MTAMNKIIEIVLDYIFPPNTEELLLRNLNEQQVYTKYRQYNNDHPLTHSIFPYKDKFIKELVWQIKYKRNQHAIKCAGYALYSEIIKYINENKIEKVVLIPIPISKARRNERGYNQCELIIDEIIKYDTDNILKKDYTSLIRSKDIDKQTHKNRNERLENSKDIFELKNNLPNDYQIIIIDDVTTTGSTLANVRNAINKSGERDVLAFTLAH